MARKVKNLSVKTREYVDGQGNKKANWQNIGVVMENDQGKQFMLIDRWVNLAGLPDFSGKPNPSAVMVTMFDVDENSSYKPAQKAGPTSDDMPFQMTISTNPIKVFTIKVVGPDKKYEKVSLVFQRASTAAKAVEKVKAEHPEWKCLVIDSHEPKPWRRDERY